MSDNSRNHDRELEELKREKKERDAIQEAKRQLRRERLDKVMPGVVIGSFGLLVVGTCFNIAMKRREVQALEALVELERQDIAD